MIQQLFGIHENQSALIVGHGPSLTPFLSQLPELKKKHIIFDTNEWYDFHSIYPHYWCLANNTVNLVNHKDRINNTESTIIYANTVDLTDKKWIPENIKRPVYSYDQRHFQGMNCEQLMNSHLKDRGGFDPSGRCCKNITETMTIQEWLMYDSGNSEFYSTGHTVAVHMVSLAILMRCNPIYIVGVDVDYRLGYAKNKVNVTLPQHDIDYYTNCCNKTIVEDLGIINESAKLLNIRLVNLNLNSYFDNITLGTIEGE